MINNKDSFAFKKYLNNKKLIIFLYLFFIIASIVVICFLIKVYFNSYSAYPLATSIFILFIDTVLFFELKKADKELIEGKRRNYFTWGRGAGAELVVRRSLMELGDGYKIISDFQTGKGNVDHICVGPTGIFIIEVKSHKGIISHKDGKLKRNNEDVSSFLGQAKSESVFLNQLIKEKLNKDYFIIPILIFTNAKIDDSINHQIQNVWVGRVGFERWVVDNCKNVLTSEEVEEVVKILMINIY